MRALLYLLLLSALPLAVQAHKNSDSFLYFHDQSWRLDIAVEGLQRLDDIDRSPRDGAVTVREVRDAEAALGDIIGAGLSLTRGQLRCALDVKLIGFTQHSDGHYAAWQLESPCSEEPEGLSLSYRLLFDIDPFHRVLYDLQYQGETLKLGVLGPSDPTLEFARGDVWSTAGTFFWQGMLHMLLGYDHLLFLLALLLPIARGGEYRGTRRDVLKASAWVITAFTVAHSVTLVAATLGWVVLPSGPVELLIAISIVVSALLAIAGRDRGRQWLLAAGFGLIHGFGFASMLSELLSGWRNTALALASFNIGVEVAQLLVMVLLLPLLLVANQRVWYRRYGYYGLLWLIAAAGLWWAAQRL